MATASLDTPKRAALPRDKGAALALTLGALCLILNAECEEQVKKRAYCDETVQSYFSERTCWWNEVCKREFQVRFRCRCPKWSFCRSPGRYYDAFCSISRTGYIWMQPDQDEDP